jgi:hypothetical protein
MDVERVKVITTVKCGEQIYLAGMVYNKPVPVDLIDEVRNRTGTVEVVPVMPPSPPVDSTDAKEASTEDDSKGAKKETAPKDEKTNVKEKSNPKETAKKKPGRPSKKKTDDEVI